MKRTLRTCKNSKPCTSCSENIIAGQKYWEWNDKGKKFKHFKCKKITK